MTAARPSTLAPYDFRRPNTFPREHARALQIVGETFARQATTALSTTLRAVSHVSVRGIQQLTYDECVRDLPNPSHLAVLTMAPLEGASLLHVPLPLAFTMVDRLLGGTGVPTTPERPLTEIEQALVRHVVTRLLHELAYAWESLTPIRPEVVQQESNPQFAQLASPTDLAVEATFTVRIAGGDGTMALVTPLASLQPVLDQRATGTGQRGRVAGDGAAVRGALGATLGQAAVDVAVRFDPVSLTSSAVTRLAVGDVIGLHHRVDAPLTVAVAGQPCFTATAGRRGARLAAVIVDPLADPAPGPRPASVPGRPGARAAGPGAAPAVPIVQEAHA
ncbi:MAG: flagellar motor switch protein FliM [Acidimicrobiia bacterium]